MPLRVTAEMIKQLHPMMVVFTSDFYYAGIANNILTRISKIPAMRSLDQDLRLMISLNIAQYFEDIVGDLGIWASFTAKHQELYGKPLPFYELDVDDYYPDELHEEDIKYVVWDTLIIDNYDAIKNPENPAIASLASDIYDYLKKEWDRAPINDAFKDFLLKAPFQHDFYQMRNMLHYFFHQCYLTAGRYNYHYLEQSIDFVKDFFHDIDDDQLFYAAENQAVFKYRIGPLALHTYQWLAMLMRENNNDLLAERFEVIEWRDIAPYKVRGQDKAFVYLLDYQGKRCALPLDSFVDDVELTIRFNKIFIGSIVKYDETWQVNGMSSWNMITEFYKSYKNHKDREHRYSATKFYNKVIKKYGGRRLFFFKDLDEYLQWGKKHLMLVNFKKEDLGDNLPHERSPAVYIAPEDSDLCIAMGAAQVIKHPDNPYYDPEKAKEDAIMVFNPDAVPDVMARYLIDNRLIPDAALNSLQGEEHGRALVQDNLDFLARTLRRHDY